jgi:hypothetical protein
MHIIHIYLLSNTMIMMISLYNYSKENVPSFETLNLFTQYILHQHLYSIYPSVDVPMDFCTMSIYIYIFFFCIKGDEGEKKHGRSSLHTKLIIFEMSVCQLYSEVNICWRWNTRKRERNGSICLDNFVFLPYIYLIDYFCYVCLK